MTPSRPCNSPHPISRSVSWWVATGSPHHLVRPMNTSIRPPASRMRPLCLAGRAEIDDAVSSAREAQREWVALTVDRRRDLLIDLADAVQEKFAELSTLNVHDYAVPVSVAGNSVLLERFLRYFAGYATNPTGRTHRSRDRSMSISSSANPTVSSASSRHGTVPWLSRDPAWPRHWLRETR